VSAPIALDDCTVEAWIKTSRTDATATFFNCDGAFKFWATKDMVTFSGPTVLAQALGHIMDGQWHHIAVRRGRTGTLEIYLDGNPAEMLTAAVGNLSSLICSGSIVVGGVQPGNSTECFAGMLTELRVWSTLRKAQDIRASMNGTLDPDQPDLILYYNFADGSPRELTGRGVPLVLQGGAEIVPSVIAREG
jgi:hypothetical protein